MKMKGGKNMEKNKEEHNCICDTDLLLAFAWNTNKNDIILPCKICHKMLTFTKTYSFNATNEEMQERLDLIKKEAKSFEDVSTILHGNIYRCEQCNKRFSTKIGLKNHYRAHKKVLCDRCGTTKKSKTQDGKSEFIDHKVGCPILTNSTCTSTGAYP